MFMLERLKDIVSSNRVMVHPTRTMNADDQRAYLNRLPTPADDIDRAFFQYLCQRKLHGWWYRFVSDIASFFLYAVYYLTIPVSVQHGINKNVDLICILPENERVNIPDILVSKYESIELISDNQRQLTEKDKIFLKTVRKRHPFAPYFNMNLLLKLSIYSAAISLYDAKAIVNSTEFSFTSSLLTAYCEQRHVKHINVMHGEKLFFMRDSFFRFHSFYIWDAYYIKLFGELRVEPKQFIVYYPSQRHILADINQYSISCDYKYYLGAETGAQLSAIATTMRLLQKQNFRVTVRPHPVYTCKQEVLYYFKGIRIEDNAISLACSLGETKYAVSLYSTVLYTAHINARIAVIDDISSVKDYKNLEMLSYIMLKKTSERLSAHMDIVNKKI